MSGECANVGSFSWGKSSMLGLFELPKRRKQEYREASREQGLGLGSRNFDPCQKSQYFNKLMFI